MFDKTMLNFKKLNGNFKLDVKVTFRRLLLYGVLVMHNEFLDLKKHECGTDYENNPIYTEFLTNCQIVLYGQKSPSDEPIVADLALFLVPTLSDLSVYVDEHCQYVRMKIHKYGLDLNMFIDKTSGDIVVECGKFEGEDSIDPTEPHNIFVGSWLDKLVQQFFLTSQQQDLLPDTQKQLYSIATTQNATIVWDQHTCDVDPKTDGGMWHNYVQSMFEKYVPSDWAGLTTNDNKDHEMSSFVKSFAIHVLKMSEHKIKKRQH